MLICIFDLLLFCFPIGLKRNFKHIGSHPNKYIDCIVKYGPSNSCTEKNVIYYSISLNCPGIRACDYQNQYCLVFLTPLQIKKLTCQSNRKCIALGFSIKDKQHKWNWKHMAFLAFYASWWAIHFVLWFTLEVLNH